MKKQKIDGICYYLYETVRDKELADKVASKMKKKGYHAKVVSSFGGYEIWVSSNPRWFYEWVSME